jgi:hypothetical protein
MSFEFARAASRKKDQHGRAGPRGIRPGKVARVAIGKRVANVHYRELRCPCRKPLRLKWKDAQQKIQTGLHPSRPPRPGCPDLRGDVLDQPGIPVLEWTHSAAGITGNGLREPKVEARIVYTNHRIDGLCPGFAPESREDTSEDGQFPEDF